MFWVPKKQNDDRLNSVSAPRIYAIVRTITMKRDILGPCIQANQEAQTVLDSMRKDKRTTMPSIWIMYLNSVIHWCLSWQASFLQRTFIVLKSSMLVYNHRYMLWSWIFDAGVAINLDRVWWFVELAFQSKLCLLKCISEKSTASVIKCTTSGHQSYHP